MTQIVASTSPSRLGIAEWVIMLFRTISMTPLFTRLTDVVAIFAVITWLDDALLRAIQQVSETAALVTPIFALVWLVAQITIRVAEFFRHREDDKDEE